MVAYITDSEAGGMGELLVVWGERIGEGERRRNTLAFPELAEE